MRILIILLVQDSAKDSSFATLTFGPLLQRLFSNIGVQNLSP